MINNSLVTESHTSRNSLNLRSFCIISPHCSLYISYDTDMEYSMEYNQELPQWVIISVILMDLMFDSKVMV